MRKWRLEPILPRWHVGNSACELAPGVKSVRIHQRSSPATSPRPAGNHKAQTQPIFEVESPEDTNRRLGQFKSLPLTENPFIRTVSQDSDFIEQMSLENDDWYSSVARPYRPPPKGWFATDGRGISFATDADPDVKIVRPRRKRTGLGAKSRKGMVFHRRGSDEFLFIPDTEESSSSEASLQLDESERALDEYIASLQENVDVDLKEFFIKQRPRIEWIRDVVERVESQASCVPVHVEDSQSTEATEHNNSFGDLSTPSPAMLRSWLPVPSRTPDSSKSTPPLPPGGAAAAAALGLMPPRPSTGVRVRPQSGAVTKRPQTARLAQSRDSSEVNTARRQIASAGATRQSTSTVGNDFSRKAFVEQAVEKKDEEWAVVLPLSRPSTAQPTPRPVEVTVPKPPKLNWLPQACVTTSAPSTTPVQQVLSVGGFVAQYRAATPKVDEADSHELKSKTTPRKPYMPAPNLGLGGLGSRQRHGNGQADDIAVNATKLMQQACNKWSLV